MSTTLRNVFAKIAGKSGVLTHDKVETFVEQAGVSNSWPLYKASRAADKLMEKLGADELTWDEFRAQGSALIPPGLMEHACATNVAAQVSAHWPQLDPRGRGAVPVNVLSAFIESRLDAKGVLLSGTIAEAGAQVLMHALDDNRDELLQKDELEGFLHDVAKEAGGG